MPMRWSDLDSLKHVNNVVYVDYAAEERLARAAEGAVPDLPVARLAIDFLTPMHLSRRAVVISSTLDGHSLTQEVRTDSDVSPVFARLTSTLGEPTPLASTGVAGGEYDLRVRRVDLDAAGNATSSKVVEYMQEARVSTLADLFKSGVLGSLVVAAIDVEFGAPIGWRPEPYPVFSGVMNVGNSSLTMVTEIRDGRAALARATTVLVAFDAATQKSRPLAIHEREALEAMISR
jgi:acyl-CoA thioester hydrolase